MKTTTRAPYGDFTQARKDWQARFDGFARLFNYEPVDLLEMLHELNADSASGRFAHLEPVNREALFHIFTGLLTEHAIIDQIEDFSRSFETMTPAQYEERFNVDLETGYGITKRAATIHARSDGLFYWRYGYGHFETIFEREEIQAETSGPVITALFAYSQL
jgi:hypothetical protein